MKQKKWTNCPACGAKESMYLKKHGGKIFASKKYPAIKIGPISEYICHKCGDGLYTIKSNNLIEAKLAEHKALYEAKTTMVAEVIHVAEASKVLGMTRQGVIQLMKRGKLPYVFLGHSRLPKRNAVLHYATSHH